MIESVSSLPESPLVYVIILNYNGWKDTIECLESISLNSYPNYKIIIVDNNSTDGSSGQIISWIDKTSLDDFNHSFIQDELIINDYANYAKNDRFRSSIKNIKQKIIFIQSKENRGFAGGNNLGIKYSLIRNDFKYIWLLNNDTVIEKESLTRLITKAQSDREIGVTGSKIFYYDYPERVQTIGAVINTHFGRSKHVTSEKDISKINYIVGASFLISKDCLNNAGLLPEEYFLYFEESDYCLNVVKNGFKLATALDSTVYHKVGKSSGSSLKDYYAVRNALYFNKKYSKQSQVVTWFYFIFYAVLPKLFRFQIKRLKLVLKAASDFRNKRMGKMI